MRTKTAVFKKLVVRRHGEKLYENGLQQRFFCNYFRHFLHHFKNRNICHVLHWYASLVKSLLKFVLI